MRLLDRSLSRLPRPLRTLVDWCLTITLAVVGVLAFQAEVAKPFRIPTGSMEPTLHCGGSGDGCRARLSDRVLANRIVYRLHAPERGDIVVFETPDAARSACGTGGTFVKRIVGLPGERISMRDGVVLVDGVRLPEPYLRASHRGRETGEWLAGDGYFVLGDNRARSCDSRRWGAVPRERIVGRVDLRYWPPGRIGDP